MSGYFQRMASLARRAPPPRRQAASPFGPARPPAPSAPPPPAGPQEALPPLEAGSPADVPPRPAPDAHVSVPSPQPQRAEDARPERPQEEYGSARGPASPSAPLGERIAVDLSSVTAREPPTGRETGDATTPAAPFNHGAPPVVHPRARPPAISSKPVRPERPAQSSAEPESPTPETPAVSERVGIQTTLEPRLPERIVVQESAPLLPEVPKVQWRSEPGRSSEMPDPGPPATLSPERAVPAASSAGDEPPAALPRPGPRARPDIEVSIGSVNLSVEPPPGPAQDRPPPGPRPKAPPPTAGGIWSGARVLSRNYLRRG